MIRARASPRSSRVPRRPLFRIDESTSSSKRKTRQNEREIVLSNPQRAWDTIIRFNRSIERFIRTVHPFEIVSLSIIQGSTDRSIDRDNTIDRCWCNEKRLHFCQRWSYFASVPHARRSFHKFLPFPFSPLLLSRALLSIAELPSSFRLFLLFRFVCPLYFKNISTDYSLYRFLTRIEFRSAARPSRIWLI